MPMMWTPQDADPVLAAIFLPEPMTLTKAQYLSRLPVRISKMMREAEPEDLAGALEMARAEGLDLLELDPMQVAESLVEESEMLAIALAGLTFPIKAVPEEVEETEAVTMGEFLRTLY